MLDADSSAEGSHVLDADAHFVRDPIAKPRLAEAAPRRSCSI